MRLTRKTKSSWGNDIYYTNGQISSGIVYIDDNKNFTNATIDKLGQLEDIEEELGIDLMTLFKALNNGFYIKYKDEIVHIFPDKHITVNFWYKIIKVFIPPKFFIDCKKGTNYLSETIDEEYWFEDYGKTWALTKKEIRKRRTTNESNFNEH